jgi:hypothetical protein
MAFLVGRRDGRFEIRESISTPAGPRARTLASFRVLTEEVIIEARERACGRFDAAKIRQRAAELRAPHVAGGAAATSRKLVAELRQGDRPPPAIVAELRRVLPRRARDIPDSLDSALEWVGAEPSRHGAALRELLRLASMVPPRSRGPLTFPRLSSRPEP